MKVAIYSRKSIETDKGDSINNQIKECKDYFLRRDKTVEFQEFKDEGFSGGNTNRPDFKNMMQHIKNNEFDVVAVYKLDRIARNIIDFVDTYAIFEKMNVKLISITEGFDFSTPMGRIVMMILASFAEMERTNISQRVKDNMRELAKAGKWTGGTVPFGYIAERIEENEKKATYLRLDDSKIELINNIFNYYSQTESMHQVQKWLYSNDIKWNLSTVKNILTSPVYVKANKTVIEYLKNYGEVFGIPDNLHGILSYNRRPYTNGKHRWNDKSMFYALSRHKGVIDATNWLKIQSLQDKNKINPRPKNSQVSYLTGTLKCAKCGSPMTVSYNHKNKDGSITYVYVCTGRKSFGSDFCNASQIKQSIYDSKFIKQLASFAQLPLDEFSKIVNKKVIPIKKDNSTSLKKKISSNEVKINNLTDKLSELSNAAAVPLIKKLESLTNENENLKKQLFLIQQEELNTKTLPVEFLHNRINDFLNIFNDLTIDEKREWIHSFIDTISFNSDTMHSNVKFL